MAGWRPSRRLDTVELAGVPRVLPHDRRPRVADLQGVPRHPATDHHRSGDDGTVHPVVRLWDGIIAVPLVGTLDSARTQVVMEKLLDTLTATGTDHAVIDITGVPTVDREVAQHLLKTVTAARLLGAQCSAPPEATLRELTEKVAHDVRRGRVFLVEDLHVTGRGG